MKLAKIRRMEQEAMLSWAEGSDDEGASARGLRIVVLRHMFLPAEAKEEGFVQELSDEIKAECSSLGHVDKVTVFPKHDEGVVVVKFRRPGAATAAIEKLDGRFFAERQIKAEFWDGKTNFAVKETAEEEQQRLDAFGDWLEAGGGSDDEDTRVITQAEVESGAKGGSPKPSAD